MKITALFISIFIFSVQVFAQSLIDTLIFGNSGSENSHSVKAEYSEIVKGALGEPARRLLPIDKADWQGGKIAFKLKIDAEKQNYLTLRFWGSEKTVNRLILYCDGKQIGYRHLGDYDILDIGADEPFYNNRFYYVTSVLPENLTKGKTELNLEIRSTGAIWSYGQTFDKYQKPMTEPTRGLYRIYTHTNPDFVPTKDEKQGTVPKNILLRKAPGEEVLGEVKERVNKTIDNLMSSTKTLNQMQLVFLASSYHVKWTKAFQNKQVIEKILKGLEGIYSQYRQNPELAERDPATPNADWFGLGPSGQVMNLVGKQLEPFFDQEIGDNGKKLSRREVWTEMLIASRDWHKRNRRLYTNQTMINDLYIYQANRGVAVLSPERADSEQKIKRYLYESVGLEPWRDSDVGGDKPRRNWGVGKDYRQLTEKGLTRELGYVGNYGEVIDWVGQIYDATRPSPSEQGDEKIKAQLEKIVKARSYFRYPALDEEGNRAMRLETVIGWRDTRFPGEVVYGERASRDASALYAAALTLNPEQIGHVQQMFADNQFFQSIRHVMRENNLRATQGLLKIPDQYELLKKQPARANRLPMSDGEPDFVFSDEENGAVAIKNGDEILYASLYWRARHAVNFLGRVHFMNPQYATVATVREEIEFTPSGLFYTRPDWTNFGFGDGGLNYPGEFNSAHAGEKLPIAKIPDDVVFKPGDESVYAGKGDFYKLRYRNYLIAMNMTKDRTFELKVPADFKNAKDLSTKRKVKPDGLLKVAPRSTAVLWTGK
jgi:hypothetical protein